MNRTGLFIALAIALAVGLLFGIFPELDLELAGLFYDPATKSFEKSDILFFSGHQYAQYRRPGVFTNDTSDYCFNMGAISKKWLVLT